MWLNVLLYLKHNCRRALCKNEFALNVPLSMMQDTNTRGPSFPKRCNIQRDAPLSEWHYSFRGIAWLVTRLTTKVSSRASCRLFKVVVSHSVQANRNIRDVWNKKIWGAWDKCMFFSACYKATEANPLIFLHKLQKWNKSGLFLWRLQMCNPESKNLKVATKPHLSRKPISLSLNCLVSNPHRSDWKTPGYSRCYRNQQLILPKHPSLISLIWHIHNCFLCEHIKLGWGSLKDDLSTTKRTITPAVIMFLH